MTPREELIALDRDSLEQQVIGLEQKLESAQFERDELKRNIERIKQLAIEALASCVYCLADHPADYPATIQRGKQVISALKESQ